MKKLIFITFFSICFCVNNTVAQNQDLETKSTTTLDDNSPTKSEFGIGIIVGKKSYFYQSKMPGFSIDYTKRSFNKLFEESSSSSWVGMGFSLGYQQYKPYSDSNPTVHAPFVSIKTEIHLLEGVSFFLDNPIKLQTFLDPYLTISPSYQFLISDTFGTGYFTAISLGCRVYKGKWGAMIELGRSAPFGGSVKVGIVIRS